MTDEHYEKTKIGDKVANSHNNETFRIRATFLSPSEGLKILLQKGTDAPKEITKLDFIKNYDVFIKRPRYGYICEY